MNVANFWICMALRSSAWIVFNNFLLIDATDKSKISSDRKRLFFALRQYPLSFFANTPFKGPNLINLSCVVELPSVGSNLNHLFKVVKEGLKSVIRTDSRHFTFIIFGFSSLTCIAGPRNWQPLALTAAHRLALNCWGFWCWRMSSVTLRSPRDLINFYKFIYGIMETVLILNIINHC